MTPAAVREFVARGHEALVQKNAGAAIGLFDVDYQRAGAIIATNWDLMASTALSQRAQSGP